MDDLRVKLEVLRLLVRLARVDGEVAPVEATLILDAADRIGVPGRDRDRLQLALEGGPLPTVDFGILRERPHAVIKAARILIAADGVLADEELASLAALERALLPVGELKAAVAPKPEPWVEPSGFREETLGLLARLVAEHAFDMDRLLGGAEAVGVALPTLEVIRVAAAGEGAWPTFDIEELRAWPEATVAMAHLILDDAALASRLLAALAPPPPATA